MKCAHEASYTSARPPSGRVATTSPSKLPPTPGTLLLAPLAPVGLAEGRPKWPLVAIFIVAVRTVGAIFVFANMLAHQQALSPLRS